LQRTHDELREKNTFFGIVPPDYDDPAIHPWLKS
jgi:hypothetical protein